MVHRGNATHRLRFRRSLALLALLLFGAAGCEGCRSRERADPDALVLVLPRDADELDRRFVGDPYGLRIPRLLFASLVRVDSLSLEVVPYLAEEVVLEDPTTYRVRLRPDLRFSDGTELDAEDVRATFESLVDPELGSRYAGTYRRITNIEVVTPREVLFRLEAPHATFLTDLEVPIVRAEDALTHLGDLGSAPPVGAGPYRLVERRSGFLRLEANPHWHEGAPRVPNLEMTVLRDDNTRALTLLAGEADLAIGAIPPLLVPMFEEAERFEVRSAPGINTFYLGVHTEALDDARWREALAYAIDREALVRAELGGRGSVAASWIPPGHSAEDATLSPRPFDPSRARALLDDAGLADPPGPEPRVRWVLRVSSDRFRVSVAHAIAAMLADVGVEVDVRPSEAASMIADLNRGRFDLCLLQVPEVFEPHVLSWFFGSDRIPDPPRAMGANRWRFRSAALDEALERGRSNAARDVRIESYRSVQRILADELPVVPLFHEDVVAVFGPRASGLPVPRDGRFGVLARRP